MINQANNAVAQYTNTGNSSIAYADPHQLILRLMNGAIDRIAQAKGMVQQKEKQQKGELIGKAIGIIGGLSACLDHNQEGDLSENLESLYEYMNLRLLQANMEDDTDKLDEVSKLLQDIRSAWVQIAKQDNI
jgi:flagellar secretion chaperone FliS